MALGRPRHRWQDSIKMDLREDGVVQTGLTWLRIGTSGELLWTFGFHKMLRSSWVAAQLAASQERFSSVELFVLFTFRAHYINFIPQL
jgi:hypothetical protein